MKDFSVKIPSKIKYIVGIDEVGRGPLAGPVTVCAVLIPRSSQYSKTLLKDFVDSKKINPSKRLELSKKAEKARKNNKIKYSISSVSAEIIDREGISVAVKKAIKRVLKKLETDPQKCFILLDGSLYAPQEYLFQRTIIKGDEKVKIISCASVLAKVRRDKFMIKMDKKYPNYSFNKHKGYGTKDHICAIKKHGVSEIHRRSFLKNL